MKDKEQALRREYRKHTTAKLLEIAVSRKEYSFERQLALLIVKEREFWKHGVPTWIASIVLTVLGRRPGGG